MSIVKSYSFTHGDNRGDMFYIQHNSKNFTIIDCYLKEGDDCDCRKEEILSELCDMSGGRIRRFISTHPDNDHIMGLELLDDALNIRNFYAVDNQRPCNADNPSFHRYSQLLEKYNYAIKAKIERSYLNKKGQLRNGRKIGPSGIHFYWPYIQDQAFQKALKDVNDGHSGSCVNNISPVILYSIEKGPKYMWMGDMLSDMQDEFVSYCAKKRISIPQVDVLFHPHHGRVTGDVPNRLMKILSPKIIVIGNAPADELNYLDPAITITQNTTGDIIFDNVGKTIQVFSKSNPKKMPVCLKKSSIHKNYEGFIYQGTLSL